MTQADDVQARNVHVIAEFRANHGQVGGDFAGAPLLLHTVGARTGKPRVSPASTCLMTAGTSSLLQTADPATTPPGTAT